jgi:hypothetical protein
MLLSLLQGVDRGVLAIMNEAYNVETLGEGKERTGFKTYASSFTC